MKTKLNQYYKIWWADGEAPEIYKTGNTPTHYTYANIACYEVHCIDSETFGYLPRVCTKRTLGKVAIRRVEQLTYEEVVQYLLEV
jgi:hypothetical protein